MEVVLQRGCRFYPRVFGRGGDQTLLGGGLGSDRVLGIQSGILNAGLRGPSRLCRISLRCSKFFSLQLCNKRHKNEREEKKQTVVDVLENLRSDIAKHNHSTRYGHRPDTSLTSRISIAVDKIKKYGIHPPEDLDMGQLHEHCGLLVPFVDQYGAKRARQEMLVWWRKARKEQ